MKAYVFLLILLGWSLTGCKDPAAKFPVKEPTSAIDTLKLSGQQLVIHWGDKSLPKMVCPLDEKQMLNGYAVEFKEDGALLSLSRWVNGLQEGSRFVLGDGQYSHQLFDQGKVIYEAEYQNQQKTDNRLYPIVIEEFFFEDKYYAKIRFPFAYHGELNVQVTGYQTVISPLPDQTFQLVVNDALDLTEYELELTYQPASKDTLHAAKYSFKHLVYGE